MQILKFVNKLIKILLNFYSKIQINYIYITYKYFFSLYIEIIIDENYILYFYNNYVFIKQDGLDYIQIQSSDRVI